jgi:hypothetical protein
VAIKGKAEIVVVDNDAPSSSLEMISSNFPGIKVVNAKANLGFAGGVNAGIRASMGRFVCLLNDDAVASAEWLEAAVSRLETDPQIGAVACKMVDGKTGDLDSGGNSYSLWGMAFPRGRGQRAEHLFEGPPFAFSGGAVILRREALDDVGLFDEWFFAYHEDVDLSYRMRLRGWKIEYEPGSSVRHNPGTTSGGGESPLVRFHSVKNTWAVYIKNTPGLLLLWTFPGFLAVQAGSLMNSIRRGLGMVHLRALLAVALAFDQLVKRRSEIQKERKVPAKEVRRLMTSGLSD